MKIRIIISSLLLTLGVVTLGTFPFCVYGMEIIDETVKVDDQFRTVEEVFEPAHEEDYLFNGELYSFVDNDEQMKLIRGNNEVLMSFDHKFILNNFVGFIGEYGNELYMFAETIPGKDFSFNGVSILKVDTNGNIQIVIEEIPFTLLDSFVDGAHNIKTGFFKNNLIMSGLIDEDVQLYSIDLANNSIKEIWSYPESGQRYQQDIDGFMIMNDYIYVSFYDNNLGKNRISTIDSNYNASLIENVYSQGLFFSSKTKYFSDGAVPIIMVDEEYSVNYILGNKLLEQSFDKSIFGDLRFSSIQYFNGKPFLYIRDVKDREIVGGALWSIGYGEEPYLLIRASGEVDFEYNNRSPYIYCVYEQSGQTKIKTIDSENPKKEFPEFSLENSVRFDTQIIGNGLVYYAQNFDEKNVVVYYTDNYNIIELGETDLKVPYINNFSSSKISDDGYPFHTDMYLDNNYLTHKSEYRIVDRTGQGALAPDQLFNIYKQKTIFDKFTIFTAYFTELVDKKIVSGYPDGSYRLDNEISRAEFSKMVTNAFEIEENIDGDTFSDLDDTHKHFEYIQSLKNSKIIDGYEDGKFNPDKNITRAEAVKILSRAYEFKYGVLENSEVSFSDLEMDNKFYPFISSLSSLENKGQKVFSGYSTGEFGLDKNITRGEVSKVIYVMLMIFDTSDV